MRNLFVINIIAFSLIFTSCTDGNNVTPNNSLEISRQFDQLYKQIQDVDSAQNARIDNLEKLINTNSINGKWQMESHEGVVRKINTQTGDCYYASSRKGEWVKFFSGE